MFPGEKLPSKQSAPAGESPWRGWFWAAGVSVALHLLLLLIPATSPRSPFNAPLTVLSVELAGRSLPPTPARPPAAAAVLAPAMPATQESAPPAVTPPAPSWQQTLPMPPLLPLLPQTPTFNAADYRGPKETETAAHVLHIDLPPPLASVSESGRLLLTIYVGEGGQADMIEAERQGVPEDFARQASDAFRRATFTPGFWGGKPVKSWMKVEVRYDVLPALDSK